VKPTEPEIVIPPDPGDIVFDELGTPMLTYTAHPVHGPGWCLYYLDDTNGVDDHFIGGHLTDMDWALEQGRDWLRGLGHAGIQ
jgi:hypothetical protein